MRPDWIPSALAPRPLVAGLVGLFALIGFTGSVYVRESIADVRAASQSYQDEGLTEASQALSQMHRLGYILARAANQDPVAEDTAAEFAEALSALQARVATLSRDGPGGAPSRMNLFTRAALERVADLGSRLTTSDLGRAGPTAQAFLTSASVAQAEIESYIGAVRKAQQSVLARQSGTLLLLIRSLEITLALMGLISISAILLLHREIVSRKERAAAVSKADYLAYNDALTRMPNRQRFTDRLSEMLDGRQTMAMLFLDLDDFKGINDTYGHGFGDVVLRTVGARLREVVEAHGGMAARLGGDEFGALLPTDDGARLSQLCNEILVKGAEPISSEGVTVQPGVSIGVATSTEVRNATRISPETMARAADFALYDSKEGGRGTYRIYDRAMDQRYIAHRSLLDAIPAAIDNEEFFVSYQPKVTLAAGRIYGFEALIRWERDGEVVSPGDFLPVAEESRLITKLDLLVLAGATRQIARWNADLGIALSVSVNLSAHHFEDFAIIDEVKFALARANLPPELLTLELTETVLLEDWEKVQDILSSLRVMGCKISLDDFGTGYSSLAYLRRIEADELKIDRTFVNDIEESQETAFILDAVVDIAKSLGMSIVVEGVETEAQARIVESFGCDRGQGYLFGKPLSPDEALERLTSGDRAARPASDAFSALAGTGTDG